MNVTVEILAPCKKLMRVEVDEQKVEETFEKVTKDYQRRRVCRAFARGKRRVTWWPRLFDVRNLGPR